jgi:uncharacterized integral membrane protein
VGQTALIAFLLLATGVAIFAVQNAGPVTVRFGFWAVEMSLVVVILVAAAVGAVMASLLSLPGWFRDRRLLRKQTRELGTLRASGSAPRTPVSPLPTEPLSRPSTESPTPDVSPHSR